MYRNQYTSTYIFTYENTSAPSKVFGDFRPRSYRKIFLCANIHDLTFEIPTKWAFWYVSLHTSTQEIVQSIIINIWIMQTAKRALW